MIVKIGDKMVQNSKEIYDAVNSGEKVEVEVLRGSSNVQISIKPEIAGKL